MKPTLLIIRDGWGYAKPGPENAISKAHLPTELMLEEGPKCFVAASAKAVGLPARTIGTSEIGHCTIGAGRVIDTDIVRINKDIRLGRFGKNPVLKLAFRHAKQTRGIVHVMGLLSDGCVHSHIRHFLAVMREARKAKLQVVAHAFVDGRDVSPKSAHRYMRELDKFCSRHGSRIGSVIGRYYAMDRDKRWDRTQKAYEALVHGQGTRTLKPIQELDAQYARGITDEFITPIVTPAPRIRHDDVVVFVNFRADRARQITRAFTEEKFKEFPRGGFVHPYFVCMAEYDPVYNLPVLYQAPELKNTLGELISRAKMRQLRVAETEKYAHVTYFFNGLHDMVFPGEERILVPSPKVATYDLSPAMGAREITGHVISHLRVGAHAFYVINFSNADMVGHTGKLRETVTAVEVVDECLGRILHEVRAQGGSAVITADHGNAELMYDAAVRQPHTAHTLNKVRLFVYNSPRVKRLRNGGLADVAPTVLKVMGLPKPKEMSGRSLF